MPDSIKLAAFVRAHPPHSGNLHPSSTLLDRYESLLPSSLLELWRTHGLGYYGELRLCLLDPDLWQAALDQWISNHDDGVPRIPMLMTPFGVLLYYRRSLDESEDICALDILERDVYELSSDLLECFNHEFTDPQWLNDLVSLEAFEHATKTAGALSQGQVYKLDQDLKDIVTIYAREDALGMFRNQFEMMQVVSGFDYQSPGVLSEALPESFSAQCHALAALIDKASDHSVPGFYLRAHICRYHLLVLTPDSQCKLLFWTTHPWDMRSEPPRLYEGLYQQALSREGDTLVTLTLDKNDSIDKEVAADQMFYWVSGEAAMLVRSEDLEGIAGALDWNDSVEHPAYPMRKVTLNHWIPENVDELPVPSRASFPLALRRLLRTKPLRVVITKVGLFEEESGILTVEARIEVNGGIPIRKNMPLCSPAGSARQLLGWVWVVGDNEVEIGMSLGGNCESRELYWPKVGDVMISRKANCKD